MLNSPTLSIFQHFHAIPLRSPLTPSGSSPDGEPRGFDAFRHLSNTLLPPSGEVPKAMGACQRLSNNVGYTVVLPPQPSGQLPRWGAKRIRRFPSSRKHLASPFGGSAEGNGGMPAAIEQCWIHRSAAPSSHFARNGVSLVFRVASLLKIQFACTSPPGSSPDGEPRTFCLLT